MGGCELLTTEEMARADQLAVVAGVSSLTLMENAGRAVADEAGQLVGPGARIVVVCGPGNNGGDGFVAARVLQERGYVVRLACLAPVQRLSGDAGEMARRWTGDVDEDVGRLLETGNDLIVDAIFGAGLSRAPAGLFKQTIMWMNEARAGSGAKVLAVDLPSGVDGNTGQPLSAAAVVADRTVTFFRMKPGHLLLPGRALCGKVVVADIGIPTAVFQEGADCFGPGFKPIRPATCRNGRTAQWSRFMVAPDRGGHKYSRGHAIVVSGPAMSTGAARLAARGALRAGAGLVTLASPVDAVHINAAHLTAIMIAPLHVPGGLSEILADHRKNVVVIGPGCGLGPATRQMVEIALQSKARVVLDADALTVYEADAETLFAMTRPGREDDPVRVVLTPHEGEYARLFPDLAADKSKLDRARGAAARSGAVVVLKGPDTVIAAPNGTAWINCNAPPWLATAGSGDVLAGYIGGLMAQRMACDHAAAAAVWLHGACAKVFGPGLIAEDLPDVLPKVLQQVWHDGQSS